MQGMAEFQALNATLHCIHEMACIILATQKYQIHKITGKACGWWNIFHW